MSQEEKMQFWGYERPDGTVGVRNYLAIVGAGNTAHHMAVQISREVKRFPTLIR